MCEPRCLVVDHALPSRRLPRVKGQPSAVESHHLPKDDLYDTIEHADGQKVEAWSLCYLFVGDKGMMAVSPQKSVLLPEEKYAGYEPPAKSIPDSIGHWAEWVAACKTGSPTGCPFSYSGPMTETVLLGNVAFRAGKKLDWDDAD